MEHEYNVVVLLSNTLYFCGFKHLRGKLAKPMFTRNSLSLRVCSENEVNDPENYLRFNDLCSDSPSLVEAFSKRNALCTHFQFIDNAYYQTTTKVNWGAHEVRKAGFLLNGCAEPSV